MHSNTRVGDKLEVRTGKISSQISYVFYSGLSNEQEKKDQIKLIYKRLSTVVSKDMLVDSRWEDFELNSVK